MLLTCKTIGEENGYIVSLKQVSWSNNQRVKATTQPEIVCPTFQLGA